MGVIKTIIDNKPYIDKANEVEKLYGIPHNMLVGVMKTESNFNNNAVSRVGARGLMQFMPATAIEFGIDPFDPNQSIEAAGKYLSQNYKKLGNWDDTLMSYNMGLGNVNKWKVGKKSLPKETELYVGKVYNNMGVGNVLKMAGDQVRQTTNNMDTQKANALSVIPLPEISNFEKPIIGDTFTEEEIDNANAEKEQEAYDAKIELQNKQNEENLFNDLLQATQLEYVDPNQVQDYTQDEQQPPAEYQQGGKIPISSQGVYEFPKQEVIVPTNNGRISFIKDNMGQWAHPYKNTEINSPSITMHNVPYPVLGISKETGEKRWMMPNTEHYYENTKNVLEIPLNKFIK